MLADSAHIQEKDAEFLAKRQKEFVEPLYGMRHAVRTMELMVAVPYNKPFDVVPGVKALMWMRGTFSDPHRSYSTVPRECDEKRLVFSGDVGRSGLAIIRDPVPPPGADAVIMESTYGNRDHESVDGARARLAEVVRDTAATGRPGSHSCVRRGAHAGDASTAFIRFWEGAIPAIPIYVDSPLAIDTTTVFQMHPEAYDQSEDMVKRVKEIFDFPLVHFTRDVEESKASMLPKVPWSLLRHQVWLRPVAFFIIWHRGSRIRVIPF